MGTREGATRAKAGPREDLVKKPREKDFKNSSEASSIRLQREKVRSNVD